MMYKVDNRRGYVIFNNTTEEDGFYFDFTVEFGIIKKLGLIDLISDRIRIDCDFNINNSINKINIFI